MLALIFLLPFSVAREFTGNGTVTIEEPTQTRLAICTPNEKYSVEPGKNYTIRLYVRNDMDNKTVRAIEVKPVTDSRIIFNLSRESIDELPATEYSYFDIGVSIPNGMPIGDYRVDFLVGTDEYEVGAFTDEMQIKVRRYSDRVQYLLLAISIVVAIVFVYRFFWFRKVNKRYKKKRR